MTRSNAGLPAMQMALATALIAFTSVPAMAGSANEKPCAFEAEIVAREQQVAALGKAGDYQALRTIYADQFLDIHGSGWLYTRDQSIALRENSKQRGKPAPVILSRQTPPRIVCYGHDTALVTTLSETNYEVPNPQEQAERAGTLTRDPTAMRRAAQTAQPALPGEGVFTNPYRIRSVRVWVREESEWKLASSQATRVSERVSPGF